jgi:hypothetical protein
MKNKIVRPLIGGLVLGLVATYAAFAAAPAGEIPVWRQLETYSQKDKSFTEARLPQLETLQKEIEALQGRADLTEKDKAHLSELIAQYKEAAGALAEHEFSLSNDVAHFATERSKEAKSKLVQLKGGAAEQSGPEAQQSGPGAPGGVQQAAPASKAALTPAQLAEQKALEEFDAKSTKERNALLEELKKLPPDPDEVAHDQLKERLRKIAVEEEAKIRLMPPGPKRIRREEFDKKIQAARKEITAKFEPAAPAPAAAPQPEKPKA